MSPITITDPIFQEKELGWLDRFFCKYINDQRDLPFIYLCARLALFLFPSAIYFYFAPSIAWWTVPLYYVIQLLFFTGPYILMLHNTSHRLFFKREHTLLNKIITWVFGPFFGQTPESYYAHHVGMHHSENNLMDDHSSTMPYQRDSFIDFLKYYFIFIFAGIQQLYQYLTFKKKIKIRNDFRVGEASFWLTAILLSIFNWQATIIVFVFPVFLYRFLMMAGNWGQHAFIDPSTPENNYRNSITCINSPYNQSCFNDGYHISHHNKPAMHWTDHPIEFQQNIQNYIAEKAIIFRKLDFFSVWLLLMLKRYDWLAKYYVQIDPIKPQTEEEIIDLMKYRTKKFDNL